MATLKGCQNELASIIRELEAIEEGVRYDFVGIGQNYCADCIDRIVSKYKSVQKILSKVDTNKLADFVNGEG
jgi:hypothetical protein